MSAPIDIPGGGAGRWAQDPPDEITVTVYFAGSEKFPRTYRLEDGDQIWVLREKVEADKTSPFKDVDFDSQPLQFADVDGVVSDTDKAVDGRKYGVRVKLFDDQKGKPKVAEDIFKLEL